MQMRLDEPRIHRTATAVEHRHLPRLAVRINSGHHLRDQTTSDEDGGELLSPFTAGVGQDEVS